mgnify:CR=1 FL=1
MRNFTPEMLKRLPREHLEEYYRQIFLKFLVAEESGRESRATAFQERMQLVKKSHRLTIGEIAALEGEVLYNMVQLGDPEFDDSDFDFGVEIHSIQ